MKRYLTRFFAALIVLLGLFSLVQSTFSFPSYDDWHYASFGLEERTLFGAVIKEWLGWNGRYTSAFVLTHSPLTWPHFGLMRAWMTLCFLACWAAMAWVLAEFGGRVSLRDRDVRGMSLLLTLLLTFFQEYTATTYFWFAGNVNYYLAWVFHLLQIALLVRVARDTRRASSHLPLVALVTVVACGFNEAAMLLTAGMSFFFLIAMWKQLSPAARMGTILTFLVAAFCTAIVVFAPGNAARASHSERSGNLIGTLTHALISPPGLALRLVAQFPILFLFPSLFYEAWSRAFTSEIFSFTRRERILAIAAYWLTLSALMAPSFWGHGGIPNQRTHYYLALPTFLGIYALMPQIVWHKMARYRMALIGLSLVGVYLKTPYAKLVHEPTKVFARMTEDQARWQMLEDLVGGRASAPRPELLDPGHEHLARYLRALATSKAETP
jgi:hypothetical protein